MKRSTDKKQHRDEFTGTIDDQLNFLEHLEKNKPPVVIEQSTGFQLASTSTRIRIELLKKFKEYGYDVTPEQGHVLNTIGESEGISQSEIAARTMKDRPTITRILDILENKKLITRMPDSGDRRIYKIYLTGEGKKMMELFSSIVREVDNKAFMGLSASDREKMKKILQGIRNNLAS
jgi:MarR family transcriptional regulator, transcriptional regulator for hemolysin